MTDAKWKAGQQAAINRQRIVTIERVTPSGRAVVGSRTFNVDGFERKASGYRCDRLEVLTPEIQAEMDLIIRGQSANSDAFSAIAAADRWRRMAFDSFRRSVPDAADVEKAERLVAAIRQVMEGVA